MISASGVVLKMLRVKGFLFGVSKRGHTSDFRVEEFVGKSWLELSAEFRVRLMDKVLRTVGNND